MTVKTSKNLFWSSVILWAICTVLYVITSSAIFFIGMWVFVAGNFITSSLHRRKIREKAMQELIEEIKQCKPRHEL